MSEFYASTFPPSPGLRVSYSLSGASTNHLDDPNAYTYPVIAAMWLNYTLPVATRSRGLRAQFIEDADRWADRWEAAMPGLYVGTSIDGRVRGIPPWERYDKPALPMFIVWPAVERAYRRWLKAKAAPREVRHRLRLAFNALRYGL